jgi:hypothetical protein
MKTLGILHRRDVAGCIFWLRVDGPAFTSRGLSVGLEIPEQTKPADHPRGFLLIWYEVTANARNNKSPVLDRTSANTTSLELK